MTTGSIFTAVVAAVGIAVWLTIGRYIYGEWNAFERVLAR